MVPNTRASGRSQRNVAGKCAARSWKISSGPWPERILSTGCERSASNAL